MGELGSGNGTAYPAALDTDDTPEVNTGEAGATNNRAEVWNDFFAALVATQTEIGTDPAGSLVDMKTNMQTEHAAAGTHSIAASSLRAGQIVQIVNTQIGTVGSEVNSVIPFDDTIPQNDEGDEILTLSITPTNASNKLLIEATIFAGIAAASTIHTLVLFQDSTASALAAIAQNIAGANRNSRTHLLRHEMSAGTTSSTTFKIRAGSSVSAFVLNGVSIGAVPVRRFGGVAASSLRITEVKV